MSTYNHVVVSIKGLEARLNASRPHAKNGLWKILQHENGSFLSWDETRIEIDKYKRKGFEVIPTCDDYDSRGHSDILPRLKTWGSSSYALTTAIH